MKNQSYGQLSSLIRVEQSNKKVNLKIKIKIKTNYDDKSISMSSQNFKNGQ